MTFIDSFISIFVDSGAVMLVLCGLMALTWFGYEGVRRGFIKPKSEEWERDTVSRVLKIIILSGLVFGVIVVITAILTMVMDMPPSYAYRDNTATGYGDHFDWFTSLLVLLMGVVMFLKPLEDVPMASLIGISAGAAAALLVAVLLPNGVIEDANGYVNMKWVLFGIFVGVATLVGLALKFWVNAITMVGKVISWPPFALIVGALCLAQGFSLWIGGHTLIML